MPAPNPSPALDGLWTHAVLLAWLRSIGVPHDPTVRLERGPDWPKGRDRVGRVTLTAGGAGTGGHEARTRRPGFQLAFRGRQRVGADEDAELLSLAADRLIMRPRPQVWVPAGAGRVRLLEVGWTGSGPTRLEQPDRAEREVWSCTYFTDVIEEH